MPCDVSFVSPLCNTRSRSGEAIGIRRAGGSASTALSRPGDFDDVSIGVDRGFRPPYNSPQLGAANARDAEAELAHRPGTSGAGAASEVYWSARYNPILWQIRQNPKIRCILPILPASLLLLLTASAGTGEAIQPPDDSPAVAAAAASHDQRLTTSSSPPTLIEKAARAAAQHRSIRAGIRQHVYLFGQRLVAGGSYLQGSGPQRPLRMEMRLRLQRQQGSVQQVYDGRWMWTYRQLGEESRLERVDFQQVRSAALRGRVNADPLDSLAAGGVPRLLQTLAENFRFDDARPTTIGTVATWTIHGRWRPEKLAALLGDDVKPSAGEGEAIDPDLLPPRMPDHVVVTLDRKHLFPYRIEFRRHHSGWFEKLIAAPPQFDELATIEWFDVRLNEPIDPRVFTYDPGDHKVIDATAAYLKRLDGR